MTEGNIVGEVFSWVTAMYGTHWNLGVNAMLTRPFSQEKVVEMECELLASNFKKLKTIDLVNEHIRCLSSGSSSHSENALNLGLKKAVDLKKQPLSRIYYTPVEVPPGITALERIHL